MNELVPLNKIFYIKYGNQLDLGKMTISTSNGVNFVSRSSKNFGIVAKIEKHFILEPYDAGLITVALGGSILESFIQPENFYTAQNIKVLTPIENLTLNEKLFYCLSIKLNRFKYSSHGREANISLDTLLVPLMMPKDFLNISISHILKDFQKPFYNISYKLLPKFWQPYRLDTLFIIKKGKRILNRDMKPGLTPCVRATGLNNGITAFIAHEPNHLANTISVSYNGSIGEAFYQESAYFALDDVNVLYPLFKLNKHIALFFCTLIRKEKFRFNYGRKWHLDRMKETIIYVPVNENNNPDFLFIESYIKSLPYSGAI